MEGDRLLTFAKLLGVDEADIEDVFAPELYATILNQSFTLTGARKLTGQRLLDADLTTTRLLKKAEAYFRVLPPTVTEFDHFTPADWLFRHPELLDGTTPDVEETLRRAEVIITALNQIIL
jgi:hypothetical protein